MGIFNRAYNFKFHKQPQSFQTVFLKEGIMMGLGHRPSPRTSPDSCINNGLRMSILISYKYLFFRYSVRKFLSNFYTKLIFSNSFELTNSFQTSMEFPEDFINCHLTCESTDTLCLVPTTHLALDVAALYSHHSRFTVFTFSGKVCG